MAHNVIMPQMGESIAEGTVTTWLKKVGERVERNEALFEIATDKVDAEIPSPAAGILKEIKAKPGDTVPINSIVAVIELDGAQVAEPAAQAPKQAAPKTPAATEAAPQAQPGEQAHAQTPVRPQPSRAGADGAGHGERPFKSSPLARKVASEHGIDVACVPASGNNNRVTKSDVEAYASKSHAPAAVHHESTQPPHNKAVSQAQSALATPMVAGPHEIPEAFRARVFDGDKVEDMAPMRAKIADHMVLSKRISPHVATVWEVDFSHVNKLRGQHKKEWAERYDINLTFNTFILKAAVDALKAFAIINASLDGKKLITHASVNLGVAVALDWGLIVPVIHKAEELNLLGLAKRAQDLASRARSKKLKPEEVAGGTFTVSNPGSFGPMFNVPIINQPQAAILGVGTIEKRPVVIDDMIGIRTRAYMSLSFDHRLIDGAVADQFMGHIKKNIESFDAL